MFTIQTDASDTGIGAVLTQDVDGEERVIAYMSQKLTSTQRKYPATERECLAVVLAIEKFRPYIDGVRFKVVTDCASLVWLRNLKDPASRLARWSMRLQQYDFELLHKKGKLNVVPDALSRAIESIEINTEVWDDPTYQKVRQGVIESPDKYPDFRLQEGRLYKYCQTIEGDGTYSWSWKLYIPQSERKRALYDCHDSTLAAHLGFFKTLKRLQERYYWPRMASDVRQYVKVCEKCQLNKPKGEIARVPMGEPRVPARPWEMIAIDYMGPYPRSKNGNKYLLVVIDVFSKFVMLKSFKRAEVVSLIKYLEENIFLVFGVPSVLISDNGSQFVSRKFKEFLGKYNIGHWLNAYYHPQANPAERVNKSILSAIRSYIDQDQRNWDEQIGQIACALRTAVHESSKFTPFQVNFGREMPVSGAQGTSIELKEKPDHMQEIKKIHDAVKDNLKSAYNRYARHYNLRARPVQYEIGDVVLKRNFKQSNAADGYNVKLDSLYHKCKVAKKMGLNTYELIDMDGKKLGKFHANDIRKFWG